MVCDEGGPDCYTWTAHNIVLLNDPALKDDECRWYGPIPQDKEGVQHETSPHRYRDSESVIKAN